MAGAKTHAGNRAYRSSLARELFYSPSGEFRSLVQSHVLPLCRRQRLDTCEDPITAARLPRSVIKESDETRFSGGGGWLRCAILRKQTYFNQPQGMEIKHSR